MRLCPSLDWTRHNVFQANTARGVFDDTSTKHIPGSICFKHTVAGPRLNIAIIIIIMNNLWNMIRDSINSSGFLGAKAKAMYGL